MIRQLSAAAAVLWIVLTAGCSTTPPPPKQEEKAASGPVYFTVDPATAASIAGKITFKGARPRMQKLRIDEDAGCMQINKAGLFEETVLVGGKDGALANVFVYVKKGLEGKQFAPPLPEQSVTIDQKSCRFAPHVLGVRVNQMIRVTNSDPVTHNIHPQPKENREWNQSQPEGSPALERRFVRPEMFVRIKCNVHSWMRAYVSVMEHPYFAVTGPDGSFEIPNLPPGDYTIEAWQEKLGTQEVQVHLEPSARQSVALTFPGATKAL